MKVRRLKRDAPGIYDVNMTPLIDVSLVLVVILMVATPMALQSRLLLQKPGAAAAPQQAERPERVEIGIVSEDSLSVGMHLVPRRSLGSVLRPLLSGPGKRQVVVRCAPDVTHGTFVYVLDEAKQCGAGQIAVLGR